MLLAYTKTRSRDLTSFFKKNYLLYGPFVHCISRLDYKPDLFRFKLTSETMRELIHAQSHKLSWDNCCDKRAREIALLNKSRYFVLYSGGIDSTVAVVSMLKTWSAENLKKVTILLTHHSIQENPLFFDKYITKFKFSNAMINPSTFVKDPDSLLITGELGDQLFGSDILMTGCELFGEDCLKGDYKKYAPRVIAGLTPDHDSGAKIFEHLCPIVEEAPFPIRTTHDFFWWYNISQKWQYVKFRFQELTEWDLSVRYGSHVLHFYDTPYFQKWSLDHHDEKIKGTWDSYKFRAKEYIYKFTKEPSDLKLLKVQSLMTMYLLSSKRFAIDVNHHAIEKIDELAQYVRQDL